MISHSLVPNVFWHWGPVSWKTIFPCDGGCFHDDSSTLHLLGTLFPFLLHQLHLRSSGIRSQRLGTPDLNYSEKKVKSLSCIRLFLTAWTVACQAPPSMGSHSGIKSWIEKLGQFYYRKVLALKQRALVRGAITICSDFGAPQNKV